MPRSARPSAAAVLPPDPALELSGLPERLLRWYDRHRRDLPWRARAGERPDPYRVWLSEIMLQQTTVATVGAYFGRFMARWPDLPALGGYTAAAIAAIAFGRAATPVDGNIERVMARLFAHAEPLPEAKAALRRLAATLTPAERAGDYAQAVMDLGAAICTPRKPKCILCPWRQACRARAEGIAESLPARRAKAEKPLRRGVAFWAVRPDGAVLLRRRPERGLLGGMMEVPSTPWRQASWSQGVEGASIMPP